VPGDAGVQVLQRRERDRQQGAEEGAAVGAEAMAEGGHVLPDEEAWDALEEIPNDSAAALILLEHHWAVSLRDVVVRAGGFRISDGFISPLDLVEVGLHSAEEAEGSARTRNRRTERLTREPLQARDVWISQRGAPHLSARSGPTPEQRAWLRLR
jgi:hypothetical protein